MATRPEIQSAAEPRTATIEPIVSYIPGAPFAWKVKFYGRGPDSVCNGHPHQFFHEADARASAARWIVEGRP